MKTSNETPSDSIRIKITVREKSALSESFRQRKMQLLRLGFNSYQEYINSDIWKTLKQEVKDLRRFDLCCLICGSFNKLSMHHTSYLHLCGDAEEQANFLVPLCSKCHRAISRFISDRQDLSIEDSSRLFLGYFADDDEILPRQNSRHN